MKFLQVYPLKTWKFFPIFSYDIRVLPLQPKHSAKNVICFACSLSYLGILHRKVEIIFQRRKNIRKKGEDKGLKITLLKKVFVTFMPIVILIVYFLVS